ncbi:MAG: hypothetical protein ISR77_02850 [Pirellulaceae bacterium]|nr:hypothetical protein [Pirellulaceae bacterium]
MATDRVAETGLLDLLTVELSQNDSLQLVERERLREAMRELQLMALVTADQVEQRLRLGKTLRADALMVLSFERQEEQRMLRVVVCDSKLGVRLWRGSFACSDESDVTQLVQYCATTVGEVRQRFAGGIRHLIAVPPFLCDDFAQKFDYLQSRYSDRLSSSLMAHAGVAVVEIEEARAVLRELQDTLSGGLERPIATIVQGRYNVDDQQRVNLQIELVHDEERREQIKQSFDLGTVGHWLSKDLSSRLLASSQTNAPTLSPKTQKAILSRHAQRFAELGDWGRSTSLREAVLTLDPNDALERALLISEYQYGFTPAVDENWHLARFAKPLPPERRERALSRAAHDYCIGLEHLAYLIRNGIIKRTDAFGLLYTHIWYKRSAVGAALPMDPLKFNALRPACVAQRQFVRDVVPLANQLPAGGILPKHFSSPFYGARYVVTTHVASDVAFNNYSAESLASLQDLLERVLPEKEKTSHSILGIFTFTLVPKAGDDNFDAWRTLLTDLSNSEREVTRLYGRFGLAMEARRQNGSYSGLEPILDEVKRLGRTDEPIFDVIKLKLGLAKRQPAAPSTRYGRPPRGNFGPLGRMQLEPIRLVIEGDEDVPRPPLIKGMLRCGQRDAYWTKDRFFVMHEPGVLRELKLTDKTANHILFWGMTWDGECIWLHAQGRGIVAIRPDGTRMATFKRNEHVPSYWKGLRLLGLSPRRVLIVGSFGETNRAWCGILEIDEKGKQSASIFFEAKYVAEGQSPEEARANPNTVFQPEDLQYVEHTSGKDYFLVGRRGLSYLQVDVETLNVTVPEKVIGAEGASTRTDFGFSGRTFLRDGRPVWAHSGLATLPNSKQILFHDGWIYRPGYVWMREDPETGRRERLQAHKLPHQYWHLQVGSSAHYGLVTFDRYNRGLPLARVTILDESADCDASEDE